MKHLKNGQSISGQVNMAARTLTAILVLPAVISLALLLVNAAWYQSSVSRMEEVAALKPVVSTDIPEMVWVAVSGRATFENCGVYEAIGEVNRSLDAMTAKDGPGARLELTVARRTMETLTQYVRQIEENLKSNVPVVESERVLEEVRDVASLVDSMLEDYISAEISLSAQSNRRMTRVVILSAVLEVLILLGALLLSARMGRRVAGLIRSPIERLEHFAGMMAGGNLSARVPPTDLSELKHLTEGINVMADRLESLIAQNRQEQENLRKSELRTLQAQINPHFLYNTLDAIVWQAEAGHSGEVIHITRALSDFFRISLSSGADWIPLAQELKHLSGYLSIQKARYRDILNYVIDVPADLGESYVLKLLLQPLVENAIYHGIKDRRGGGLITVTGREDGGFLCFCVQDTGRGMTPDQLRDVRARMRGELPPAYAPYANAGTGFGLNNVDRRIRLYYDQEEGLSIESGPEGTRVSFRVPRKTREEIVDG